MSVWLVFGPAKKTALKGLDRIYTLCVELGVLPPHLRRKQISMGFYVSIWANDNQVLHVVLFGNELREIYNF